MQLLVNIFIIIFYILIIVFILIFPLYMMAECFQSYKINKKAKTIWITLMFFVAEVTPIYGMFVARKKFIFLMSIVNLIVMVVFYLLAFLTRPVFSNDSYALIHKTLENLETVKAKKVNYLEIKELKNALEILEAELKWEKIGKQRKQIYFGVYKVLELSIEDKKLTRFDYLFWMQYFKYRHLFVINTLFLDMSNIGLNVQKKYRELSAFEKS